jgi:hypothetical protein
MSKHQVLSVRGKNKIVMSYINKDCAELAPSKKYKRRKVGNKFQILK